MTAAKPDSPEQFGLLATFLAGRSIAVATVPAGKAAHTDGKVVFVSAGVPLAQQRKEVVVQSALLGAGSLDQRVVEALRGRPVVARRYLALEGRRVLAELPGRVPLVATFGPSGEPDTTTADESLEAAGGTARIADPPEWFGTIEPGRLLRAGSGPSTRATNNDLRRQLDLAGMPETEDDNADDHEGSGGSRILKLFENPVFNSQLLADQLRKLFGSSRAPGDGDAGAERQARVLRRARVRGDDARPAQTTINFVDDGKPGAAIGVGGALHPEWDVHGRRYRPEWCRVIDFPLTVHAGLSAAAVPHDGVLRNRLARVGLGPKALRGRPDGEELDINALIDLMADVRSGYSPPENVYTETRYVARNLGALVLLDASGSATETDPEGLAVHEHHCRAAATLAATLEELGDRVAVYAFRSDSRHAVHLPAIKTFEQRFGAVERARLNRLHPAGYTRLGAGIRGAGRILDTRAGTPYRLLLVLSDGHPYDHGYEGRYAEADTAKAIEELRADGIACLCLSIGAGTSTDALERVFGPAGYAHAATLAELSPHMDELFMASLRELAAPRAQR
ncbi:VWA domain-containing protein [Nocardia zapadnayensis]|uniref:nitric oxide reductase activation protein NorD n=1 Tax=Nocardia rhamnosiphila TaxID=426716 RepID=UPI002247E0CE|nr:VWA domain-containing protein [Nocardia zapadnayensis]MCX0272937.1 VWA domain-containing protein [Nocardia zapadnayensis]